MKEDFVQYIWQYQQFNKNQLRTVEGNTLEILKVGNRNSDAGPDFLNARIVIDGIEWAGQVEIHTSSSIWFAHKHEQDSAYNNVVLHVVWEYDKAAQRENGSVIPTLELKNIGFENTFKSYQNLIKSNQEIACSSFFGNISHLAKISMLEKAVATRLESKTEDILNTLETTNHNWEETAYLVYAKNMGFKLNVDVFFRLASNLPLKVLQKHRGSLFQIEALVFGQAGFLEIDGGDYQKKLKDEYLFLAKKYEIFDNRLNIKEWKFLRTRPSNFPTVRLAQFAAIVNHLESFFSVFINESNDIRNIFRSKPSEYWQNNYDFEKQALRKNLGVGKSSVDIILINVSANLLAAYSKATGNYEYFDKAINVLENLPPEKNNITKKWENLSLEITSSFDSQAVIQQFNTCCKFKKCVNCPIGTEYLKGF